MYQEALAKAIETANLQEEVLVVRLELEQPYVIIRKQRATTIPYFGTPWRGLLAVAIPESHVISWSQRSSPTYASLVAEATVSNAQLARAVARETGWRLVDALGDTELSDGEHVLYSTEPHAPLQPEQAMALIRHWGIRDIPPSLRDGNETFTQVKLRALADFETRYPASVVTHQVTITHGGSSDVVHGPPAPAPVRPVKAILPDDPFDLLALPELPDSVEAERMGQSIDMSSDPDDPTLTIEQIEVMVSEAGAELGAFWNALAGGERAMAPRSLVAAALAEVRARETIPVPRPE